MITKPHVLCLGNIAFDMIKRKDVSLSSFFDATLGGSVLNTSIILSKLGTNVGIISKTGADFLGDSLLKILRKHKIDILHV